MPPGGGPPPHIHYRAEEAFYVLDGEVTVTIGDRIVHAVAGGFVLVPRGTVHAITNTGTTTARVLVIFSPAGMEEFFVEREALRAAGASEYGEEMTALRGRYATETPTPT